MASVAQQAQPATCTPDIVGNAFVHQYYHILHQSPQHVHRFYQDISKLGRPEENGLMSITTTMQAINEKILSLGYGDFSVAEITTVDAQDSFGGGVLVLVTGYLTGKDSMRRKFAQTFFLAPQDRGYFVLNDIFRYVSEANSQHGGENPANGIEEPVNPQQNPSPASENHHDSKPPATLSKDVPVEKVCKPSENGDGEVLNEEAPIAQVVDEASDALQKATDTNGGIEGVPKKSYASILKHMKEGANTVTATASPPKPPVSKSQEQQVASAPPPAAASETSGSGMNMTENNSNPDAEVEGPSIYVKGLPSDATPALLENEFKKFGHIRSGGIQVRSQRGFCFGFVEFDDASAVQAAIEASPLMIGGRRAVVEEKRSTSRGNNRARSSSGPGNGYRNEGMRGRGSYGGGRGYGRGDFNNRNEYGNRGRGGFSNRGGDGGGRVSRAGGVTHSAAARATAPPRVSATA